MSNVCFDFVEFINEKGLDITRKGKIYCLYEGEKVKLTDSYAEIKHIEVAEKNLTGIELDVNYVFWDAERIHTVTVTYLHNNKIMCNWDILYKQINKYTVNEKYRQVINSLYKEYFGKYIKEFIKCNPWLFNECGWFRYNGTMMYMPLDDIKTENRLRADFFNGILQKPCFRQSLEELTMSKELFAHFFNLILSDRSAMMIFAYSIHAVLWNGIYGYGSWKDKIFANAETVNFSICICGQNEDVLNIIANLLANVFNISENRWSVVSRKYHISASAILDDKFQRLMYYKSVPVIVKSKSYRFTRAHKIVKRFQIKRDTGDFHIFPVYLSKNPINADEIVNCTIDSVDKCIDIKNKELLQEIHEQYSLLIINLIKYFSKIADTKKYYNREDYDNFVNVHRIVEKFSEENWIDHHVPEILLYASMDRFCCFLEKTPLNVWVADLRKKMKSILSTEELSISDTQIQQSENYLVLFKEFAEKMLGSSQKKEWLFTGIESRGGKEECYYLQAKVGFRNFEEYLRKRKIPLITERNFINLLVSSDILKLPRTGSSKSQKRRGIYVYVIKKALLDGIEEK